MKKYLGYGVLALVLVSPCAALADGNTSGFGLGVILGEPSGLSGKLWSDGVTAYDIALAWSTSKNAKMDVHADYVWHRFDSVRVESGALPFYYGIGVRYRGRDVGDDNVGVRFPLGLDYLFARSSYDVFLEVVPIMDLAPDSDFDLSAGLGARLFF